MIPISIIGGRGLIFDLDHIKLLREKYHICGTLIGILPQIPQQNVFMGLPLELMPEDIELLVNELKVAYLVDDSEAHRQAVSKFTPEDAKTVQDERQRVEEEQLELHKEVMWERRVTALELKKRKDEAKERKRLAELDVNEPISSKEEQEGLLKASGGESESSAQAPAIESSEAPKNIESSLQQSNSSEKQIWLEKTFSNPQAYVGSSITIPNTTTPTKSSVMTYKPLAVDKSFFVPRPSRASYNLYKELQSRGFFVTSGLRFGGQFVAYPGDPLRFHSHHIGIGFNWDQEFDVLDIVGGARLGTSVKKCWVIGAEDPSDEVEKEYKYRVFSVEWAGFG